MYQKITVVGRVGADAELKYTPSGVPVASFNVATSRKFKGQDGEQKEVTTWHRCTAWRKTAELSGEYVKKGMLILVEGPAEVRAYIAKSGEAQGSLEVTVENMKFLSRGSEETQNGRAADPTAWVDDGEIPF